eukprot:COSAG06_NODE_46046_length_350_cov_0.593625_1_plen_75_part_10
MAAPSKSLVCATCGGSFPSRNKLCAQSRSAQAAAQCRRRRRRRRLRPSLMHSVVLNWSDHPALFSAMPPSLSQAT